jgi:hypothetical protein
MSAQPTSPLATVRVSEIVDLTQGMSDLEVDEESGTEDNNHVETKDTRKSRKKKRHRVNRRTTKSKKVKELEELRNLQAADIDDNASNEGMLSVFVTDCTCSRGVFESTANFYQLLSE